jgi:hypothetical protein
MGNLPAEGEHNSRQQALGAANTKKLEALRCSEYGEYNNGNCAVRRSALQTNQGGFYV